MSLRKFGTGEVLGADESDPQGIRREAIEGVQGVLWGKRDSEELAEENQEGDLGRKLPPTS